MLDITNSQWQRSENAVTLTFNGIPANIGHPWTSKRTFTSSAMSVPGCDHNSVSR